MALHGGWMGAGSDDESVDSCMRCGGEWRYVDGWHVATNGDSASDCVMGRVHGIDKSSHALDGCKEYDETGHCEHVDHDCNCVACD